IDPQHILQVPAFNLAGLDFLFAIAFVIGLFTLNTLSALKEEGEVCEEVVLEELMSRTRAVTRAVSSVPAFGFMSLFPFTYLRQVPGLNVALTVTAFQISDMARMTTLAASKGLNATAHVAHRLQNGIEAMLHSGGLQPSHGAEVARHTARGVIHAGDAVDMNTRQLVHSAIVSTVRAFDNLNVNSEDAFRGAGYGVIQGAVEKGMNVVDTAVEAIEGARDAAATLDIAEEKVMGYAVAGVLKGVEEINPRALPKVKKTLPRKLLELYERTK
ncbi:MAG: hypothetical protein P8105_07460, partial [Dehalococcoidia bacterium]